MATYNLRRFSEPDALKAIGPGHLTALLNPFCEYLAERGVALPASASTDGLNYEGLVGILMTPDEHMPSGMAEALYFVHEMATPEAMNGLLDEVERNGLRLDDNPNQTPADVAIQVWLQDRDLLERKHAEQFLTRPRSFEYFQTDRKELPDFDPPTPTELAPLEKALDDWFENKKRGRGCRVFVFPRDDGIWFLVRHGDPFKREGSLTDGQSTSVFYRPEKHDVLVYQPTLGELRMNAASKGEKDAYRRLFGQHLFGSESFFPGRAKYTLEPLRKDGSASLVCADVEGMDWVKLREVQYFWGGAHNEVEVRKADDVFAALETRGRSMPEKARITKATFLVKFSDTKQPRAVTIRPSNIAQYTRDSDAVVLETWLMKRHFIVTAQEDAHVNEQPVLAGAGDNPRADRSSG